MAEMIIMLRRDPNSGKQNIIVKLDSDPDALPHEHEQMHREQVAKLLGKKPEDFGEEQFFAATRAALPVV